MRGGFQYQHGRVGVAVVLAQAEFDTLPFEGGRVGLYLHILIQKAIDGFLCFVKLHSHRGLCMQFELLFYGSCQVPAEKHQSIATMAFGMQEPPGFIRIRQDNSLIEYGAKAPNG